MIGPPQLNRPSRAKTLATELVTYHGEIAKKQAEHRGTLSKRKLDAPISNHESGAAT
jgi:hypothetical protein